MCGVSALGVEVDGGEGCWPVVSVGPGVSNSHSDALDHPRPRLVGDSGTVEPVADAVAAGGGGEILPAQFLVRRMLQCALVPY